MTKCLNQTAKHDIDIELMRIIASFFVVMIHLSGTYSTDATLFNSISRFSVPAFVIISGYNMLAKEPKRENIAKKCVKLFFKMLVWSGIYYIYRLLCAGYSYEGVLNLLKYLVTEPVHLWYCYASIALYLFTPILYIFHENASKKDYQYALMLTFIFGSIFVILIRSGWVPILQIIIDKTKAPYMLGFISLYLFGGYLRKYGIMRKTNRHLLYFSGATGVLITFIGTLHLKAYGLQSGLLLSFLAPNNILAGAAFFLFIQRVCKSFQNKLCKIQPFILKLSDCTLGVYFLHPLIFMVLWDFCLFKTPSVHILQKTSIVFIVSLAVVFAAKRIPVLKRLF